MRPFRFGVMTTGVRDRQGWLEQVRRIAAAGASTVFASDHFSDKPAPLPALAVAAEHTRLGVGTLVLGNDFRHPAVLAKEAATVDLLSGGRLELGIGTGWARGDYDTSGIDRDRPGIQVDRLEEAVQVLRGLWGPGRHRFDGEHYTVDMEGLPKSPGPTLLIGGGARRMLGLAGRYADIVGISAGEIVDRGDLADAITTAGETMGRKIEWIRRGAGDRFDELELNILLFGVTVSDDRVAAAEQLAGHWGGTADGILASPHFLVGTHDEIASDLVGRRERWGISYPVIPYAAVEDLTPVITRLTGT